MAQNQTDIVYQNASNNADARMVAVDDAQRSAVLGQWFFQRAADIFAGSDTPSTGRIDTSAPILGVDRYGNLYTQGRTGSDTASGSAVPPADAGFPPLLILAALAWFILR